MQAKPRLPRFAAVGHHATGRARFRRFVREHIHSTSRAEIAELWSSLTRRVLRRRAHAGIVAVTNGENGS
jgi:hypothetical protein